MNLGKRSFGYVLSGLVVHGADIQDRDGAPAVLNSIRRSFPWLRHIFADGGYAVPKLRSALDKIGQWTLQIVKRSDAAKGFEIIPRRWVVEQEKRVIAATAEVAVISL